MDATIENKMMSFILELIFKNNPMYVPITINDNEGIIAFLYTLFIT